MIKLDETQRAVLKTELKRFGLQDYADHVELVILGQAAPADILRLIRVFCQTSYLKGQYDSSANLNRAIKKGVIL